MKRFVIERERIFTQTVKVPFTYEKSSYDSERLLSADDVKLNKGELKYHALFDVKLKATTKHVIDAESKEEAEQKLNGFKTPTGRVVPTGNLSFVGLEGKHGVKTEPQKLSRDFISDLERVSKQALNENLIDFDQKAGVTSFPKTIEIPESKSPNLPDNQHYEVEQEGQVLQRNTFEVYYLNATRDNKTKKINLGGLSLEENENARKLVVTADVRSNLKPSVSCSDFDAAVLPDQLLGLKVVQLTSPKDTTHPDVLTPESLDGISDLIKVSNPVRTVEQRFKRDFFTASISVSNSKLDYSMEKGV